MATLDDFCGAALLSDDDTEKVNQTIERMVSLEVSLAGLALRGCDLARPDLADVDRSEAEARRTLGRIAGTYPAFPDQAAAPLRDTGVTNAELEASRQDLWAVLSLAEQEVPAIRAALVEGWVEGGTYYGGCACLIGTIANARGCAVYSLGSLRPAPDRPIEHLFMRISRGDTPQNNPIARVIVQWIDEWRARNSA